MKILYGVQGTGNGHITRARVMAEALSRAGIEVDWLFSGRDRDKLFDMDVFGDYRVCRGLTFQVRAGRIDWRATVQQASMIEFLNDVRSIDFSGYDQVITDYEPVVAWAARRSQVPCIGIGHQYAFHHDIPKAGHSKLTETLMRWFAPVTIGLGLHWHPFGANILPPIIDPSVPLSAGDPNKTLVYLPFENSWRTLNLINHQTATRFVMHCADIPPGQYANVAIRPFSRNGFQESLRECGSVVSSAGFELISEALTMGKRILVKPLHGQMEQASNALALEEMGLATVTGELTADALALFLRDGQRRKVNYPDVAAAIVTWLRLYPHQSVNDMVDELWSGVRFPDHRQQRVA